MNDFYDKLDDLAELVESQSISYKLALQKIRLLNFEIIDEFGEFSELHEVVMDINSSIQYYQN